LIQSLGKSPGFWV